MWMVWNGWMQNFVVSTQNLKTRSVLITSDCEYHYGRMNYKKASDSGSSMCTNVPLICPVCPDDCTSPPCRRFATFDEESEAENPITQMIPSSRNTPPTSLHLWRSSIRGPVLLALHFKFTRSNIIFAYSLLPVYAPFYTAFSWSTSKDGTSTPILLGVQPQTDK